MNEFLIHRRTSLGALAAVGLAPAASLAPEFPCKPVCVMTSFPAGSGPDTMLRFLGERLPGTWGQSVPVGKRPGAAGRQAALPGTDRFAAAEPIPRGAHRG